MFRAVAVDVDGKGREGGLGHLAVDVEGEGRSEEVERRTLGHYS